jgi:hypothetical protein
VVDHEDPSQVAALVAAIFDERGRLDLLVDDIFGGDRYMEWDKPLWEHDLAGGLRMLRMGVHTHLITRQAGALRGDAGFRDLRVACLRGQGCCRAGGGGRC